MNALTRRLPTLLFGVFAFLMPGCGMVVVKKPAGDAVPELDPAIWNGKWIGDDGSRGVCRIKDRAAGIVEVRCRPRGEAETALVLIVRELKDRLVVSVHGQNDATGGGNLFFRIAATKEHMAFFPPRFEIFRDAVRKGKIAGEEQKVKMNLKETESSNIALEKFGSAEAERLLAPGDDSVLQFFEPDPATVFVREAAEPAKPVSRSQRKR